MGYKSQIVIRGAEAIYQWLEKRYKAIYLPEETRDKAKTGVLNDQIGVEKKAIELLQQTIEWKMKMYNELGVLEDKIEELKEDIEKNIDPLTKICSLKNKGAIHVISSEVKDSPTELPPGSEEK